MSRILRNLKILQTRFQKSKIIFVQQVRSFKFADTVQQSIAFQPGPKVGPLGWFLLLIPGTTFGLGTWQVQRKKWKEDLITHLKTRSSADPIDLPNSLEEIVELEYYPVHVKGHFLHDKEIYIGPRTLIKDGDAATTGSLMSNKTGRDVANGYLVVTPFKLSNREETILVNRGWVPHKYRDPRTREVAQADKEVDVVGIIRMHEPRPVFMPTNAKDTKSFLYRDLIHMCEKTGADPIFLDATNDFDIPGGPVGGQTRITLRNEHWSYILTWYSLCGCSSLMWYLHFIKGIKI